VDERPHHLQQTMENPRAFNLSVAVREWRERIANSPALREDALDELEDHLRENIASFELRGLTEQEAFWVAQHRLGPSEALEAEFGKVNRSRVWLDRALWMVLGSLCFGGLASLTYSLANAAELGTMIFMGFSLGPLNLILHPIILGLLLLLILRWAGRSNVALFRLGKWATAHPILSVVTVIAIMTVLQLLNGLCSMLTLQSVSSDHYPAVMKWRFSSSMVFSLFTPILLGWLLFRTRRSSTTYPQK